MDLYLFEVTSVSQPVGTKPIHRVDQFPAQGKTFRSRGFDPVPRTKDYCGPTTIDHVSSLTLKAASLSFSYPRKSKHSDLG
jgi:hypothetical protein